MSKTKRLVNCEQCGTKYTFTVPEMAGVFRIKCPNCQKYIIFKVPNKN